MSFPQHVALNVKFFEDLRLWHVVRSNDEVRTCPDAAQRRMRLGKKGIPLCDELKTGIYACSTGFGPSYAAVHCRGHQRLDEERLAVVLGCPVKRLPPEELSLLFGARIGLVNPFSFAARKEVKQIFDETVLKPYFPPHTMMTNLGDLHYGVEFRAADVIGALENTIVADIIEEEGKREPKVHRLGILTGNGPESGILLWQLINARIRKSKVFRGDISFPSVFIESSPGMGLSMELEEREVVVRDIVLDGVRRLCDRGATVVGIACNTTQYFSDQVAEACNAYGVQFVKIAEETAAYLRRNNIMTFDFLGIGAVSDFKKWSDFRSALTEFDVRVPSEKGLAEIKELAYDIKEQGVTNSTINRLTGLINRATSTQFVVLALTELSIVFASQKGKQRPEKTVVDTLTILAETMADTYLQEYVGVWNLDGADSLASSVTNDIGA